MGTAASAMHLAPTYKHIRTEENSAALYTLFLLPL